MRTLVFVYLLVIYGYKLSSQEYTIYGNVRDATTATSIPEVLVTLKNSKFSITTTGDGAFILEGVTLDGKQQLVLSKAGYKTLILPITLEGGKELNLFYIPLEIDLKELNEELDRISLTETELNSDEEQQDNIISGLLGATNDAFSNAAAYDFSSTFFRPRGLDSKYSKVLINGIELNKINTGRPQWGNWGGLNDVMRNREFSLGIQPSEYSFGAPAGVLHFNMHASQYRRGGRVSYAYANRTYTGRVMGSYSSGLSTKGWAFTILGSRRFGAKGAIKGTSYEANSIFLSIEKKLTQNHRINLVAFYTPNRRGRSTALTQEVIDLKGNDYNPNWGLQNGKIRNSRMREIEEPIFILSHEWSLSDKTTLSTNLAYQRGTTKNSRIDYTGSTLITSSEGQESFIGGARNPAPNYYQNLPSYFLRFPNPTAANYQNAYLAQEAFTNDGQLDWSQLYAANTIATNAGLNSIYAVQNDVNKDSFVQASSILNSNFSEHFKLTAGASVSTLKSSNYAQLEDLLGGNTWLDIDNFAEDDASTGGNLAQTDLNNRNRIVREGDRYKYNFDISAFKASGFTQLQATFKHIDFYTALQAGTVNYQRNGLYENGYYPGEASLGKSSEINFTTYGLKGGFTYKFSGKHFALFNAGLQSLELPSNTVFTNSRQNNAVIEDASAEKLLNLDASYVYRSALLKAKLTGYYLDFANGSELSFFYTQSLQSPLIEQGNALVQEVTTNISRRNIGLELGIEYKILPTLTFKTAAALSQNTFTNNPDVYYTTTLANNKITFGDGTVKLKNYHVSGGPEQAIQLGFDYRDPDFWWLGASINRFSNAYIDVSNLRRSGAFSTDYDGLPFNDFDPAIARDLLIQEKIGSYYLLNIVGGKSWLVKGRSIGFFATINNALNTKYKTGGFEDSRIADYRGLQEEKEREQPLFGNRYFLGYGATIYANLYVRF
ncbi:carboxypeptidase regulatory-like domain-containing protein [Leeuwenhoekiella sp. MAR_2009_132]|uniref:carboxypeptidase regulatory-like domain-containing protein n=1 Tax=Leeuwenhoekiella sp. MAR_2009_132 TaxID=1392489 RepID=UPI00048DE22A|nr:carboxypeptidase regulatory-like domain-containing protein [Leeuwenhoekiella sp. MAR_2009_132]